MKKALFSVVFTLLLSYLSVGLVRGQDLIIKLNGDELAAKVLEIGIQNILYKLPDPLETDTLTIPKREVFMIRFANGTREVFTESLPENQTAAAPSLPTDPTLLHQLGTRDARLFYRASGAFWGSAGLAFIALPTYGASLLGSVAIGATPPREHTFAPSDRALLLDPAYVSGYKKQAHKRKINRTLAGTGAGAVAGLATVAALVIVAFSGWN